MAKQVINIGASPNDKHGDPLRTAFGKVNNNFDEIYAALTGGVNFSQVNADWNATSGVAQILHKPTIPTVPSNISAFTNDVGYLTSNGIPSQSGNSGKYLTTNGTALSWSTVSTSLDRLVSGSKQLVVGSDSLVSFPAVGSESLFVQGSEVGSVNSSIAVSAKNNLILTADVLGTPKRWQLSTDGSFILPPGGTIKNSDGTTYSGGGGSSYDQSLNTTDSPTFAGLTVEANNASVSLKGSTTILGAFNGTGYNEWSFYGDGSVNLPVLGSSDRTGTGNNLQFTRSGYQKIISTQNGASDQHSVERLVISGGDSYTVDGFWGGEGGDVYLWAGQGYDGGDIKVDAGISHGQNATGGTIKIRSGNSDGENATGGFLELRAGNATNTDSHGGNVDIYAGYGSSAVNGGNITLHTSNATWSLDPNGITSIGNTYTKTTTSLAYDGQDFVVWTSTVANITSVKLLIQIESYEANDTTGTHTQTCEAVIAARGWIQTLYGPGEEPVMTVYGVVHTSNNPLATFTVRRNSTTNKIEVLSRNTSTSEYTGSVRIHSVEIVSNNV